ncbi:hypothetical protein BDA96_02G210900 [Sorghum bicolor]|uniref:NAC domain-containing protein n=2 Tax=Sorghum bicolor TaxID=4558 RepID=A0A921RQ03_SORBI|nr:protein FEZ [Sorghum bicolor]KAG0543695.1 hypothetical protein BDA96_02G210900 [Sorghum bicolor]OQU89481.1 hypothetical protein SORBI_3002G200300 [Sorghum bicolor]|eukprot:XP_021307991.1 protein FEZ [Sorghum bicolor]
MDERADMDKSDEVLLPGFRFHPTDEELISFYLKRKIQQKPVSIELIRQLDIYKYDPWDLPKLASTGEKEWYFYCPRDRKYRNSARPNRVTGAGFWKATGTDRPVYSSEGTKCIGLKKSLVFYKGRAARGIKTDWMMHEYRLPSLNDPSRPKTPKDKNIPANDAWAICRIFKKPNSVAQRVLSHSWGPQSITTTEPELLSALQSIQASHFALESSTCSANRFNSQQCLQENLNNSQDGSPCKVITFNRSLSLPSEKDIHSSYVSKKDIHSSSVILPLEIQSQQKSSDATSVLLSMAPGILNSMNEAIPNTEFGLLEPSNGYIVDWATDSSGGIGNSDGDTYTRKSGNGYSSGNECGIPRKIKFPFNLGVGSPDDWTSNMPCDSLPCSPHPAEMSNSNSTEKYYA